MLSYHPRKFGAECCVLGACLTADKALSAMRPLQGSPLGAKDAQDAEEQIWQCMELVAAMLVETPTPAQQQPAVPSTLPVSPACLSVWQACS